MAEVVFIDAECDQVVYSLQACQEYIEQIGKEKAPKTEMANGAYARGCDAFSLSSQ